MATLRSNFGKVARDLPVKAQMVVEKVSVDAEAEARMRSRIDTGNMVNAWEVRRPSPFRRQVSNGVEYAIFNELGTVHMSAQPMLIPAFERQKPVFAKAVKQLLKP